MATVSQEFNTNVKTLNAMFKTMLNKQKAYYFLEQLKIKTTPNDSKHSLSQKVQKEYVQQSYPSGVRISLSFSMLRHQNKS